jgi:hypothetical protein
MKGGITKRGEKWYEITIDLGRDERGKRLRKYENVRGSKAEAERRKRDILSSLDKGLPVHTGKITVGSFLQRWLRDEVAVRNRPRTIEGYTTIVHKHIIPTVGYIQLAKL